MKTVVSWKTLVRLLPHAKRWFVLASLQAQNLLSRKPVTGEGEVVLSLTTYGTRTGFVHLAIESIGRGTVLPGRLILWLDEPVAQAHPPKALVRLAKRGVEILPCPNYGPHKKYFPYVESLGIDETPAPLVIVDDDFIYPRDWLAGLLDSYRQYPEAVSCTRAHEFQIPHDPAPYSGWPACTTNLPSARTFATGVGGVLYPPDVQFAIRSHGRKFENCAPKADDVWLHYVTVSSGKLVRQIKPEAMNLEFRILPFGQKTALQNENVGLAANDIQISSTYDAQTLDLLRKSP